MNVFVANIDRTVKDDALKALFAVCGEVTAAKILTDTYTGESKGFGFVDMRNEKEGMDAIRKLTHAEFFGRKLVVSKARPKISAY
jgi:RNA recognition motif-containing protein